MRAFYLFLDEVTSRRFYHLTEWGLEGKIAVRLCLSPVDRQDEGFLVLWGGGSAQRGILPELAVES